MARELKETHRGQVRTIVFSRNSRFLATSSRDGTVLIHELVNGTPIFRRRLETGLPIGIAALNADGTQLAIGTTKGEMILWDVKREKGLRELTPFQVTIYCSLQP